MRERRKRNKDDNTERKKNKQIQRIDGMGTWRREGMKTRIEDKLRGRKEREYEEETGTRERRKRGNKDTKESKVKKERIKTEGKRIKRKSRRERYRSINTEGRQMADRNTGKTQNNNWTR